jgi:fucose permease
LKEKYGISIEKMGLLVSWGLFYLPLLTGRFLGAWIMTYVEPKKLLRLTVLLSLLGLSLIFTGTFYLTLIGIFIVGFGFANIFPLIFSITIEHLPEKTNELSGLMVSAVVGGAFIPPIMSLVADNLSIQTAFIVPVICLLYLLFVALLNNKKTQN